MINIPKYMTFGLIIGISGVLYKAYNPPQSLKKPMRQANTKHDCKMIYAIVTAYCPCKKCCGQYSDGITSRGRDAFKFRGVAVDPKRIKYGSLITIPGAGTFIADDTGSAMRNSKQLHIDLRFKTHQQALNWGVKRLHITIKEK